MLALSLVPLAGEAQAGPGSPKTAAVTMGDSYISGEAGRWAGNSIAPTPGHDGTDRACVGTPVCAPDLARVYLPPSDTDGCHRSDVSELLSAQLAVTASFNIACSGAVTKNLFRSSNGGVAEKGEPPQADQLLPIAQANDVKLIVVNIGGNDLGFSDIVTACFLAYTTKSGPCGPAQTAAIKAKLPAAETKVEKVVDEVRAVMSQAGYADDDYRLVMQGGPAVIPPAARARYPQSDSRRLTYGCPFYDADLDTARTVIVPAIGALAQDAARAKGVEYLAAGNAFDGHEICASTAEPVTASQLPSPTASEWGRALSSTTIGQGQIQEVFHPNAFGQRALGICLKRIFRLIPGEFDCTSGPGRGPGAQTLSRTATTAAGRTLLRDALRRAVVPNGSRAKIARVLRAGGYRAPFSNAVGPGRLLLAWYRVRAGEPVPKPAGAEEPVLVARERVSVTETGTAHFTLRLKAAGKRLLRAAGGPVRLAGRATFTPKGGGPISTVGRFRLG